MQAKFRAAVVSEVVCIIPPYRQLRYHYGNSLCSPMAVYET